jgi:hypothetical protein
MEKKIAELEMGLLHLQQNIDIPGTGTAHFFYYFGFRYVVVLLSVS